MNQFEQAKEALKGTSRSWLVTGVAGFIGSNLLQALLESGQKVVGVDNFSTGCQRNLDEVQRNVGRNGWANFTFIQGDVADPVICGKACTGIEFVLHQAALGSVPRSIADPQATNRSNVDGFLNMLVAARDAKVRRFVYASSGSVYGDHPGLPKVEAVIGKPLSPYALTKYVNELYAEVFAKTYSLNCVGLRYFNVFGPRQNPAGPYAAVIPMWISTLLSGQPCVIHGDGETTRDFCYVENVLQANLLAAVTEGRSELSRIYNIAVGERTTLRSLYAMICDRLLPYRPDVQGLAPLFGPFRPGDVRHSQADIRRAKEELGYLPSHTVAQGLDAAMPWYVQGLGAQ